MTSHNQTVGHHRPLYRRGFVGAALESALSKLPIPERYVTNYDAKFYKSLRDPTCWSARAVIPLILRLMRIPKMEAAVHVVKRVLNR
jgi:hypothetical protein